MDMKSDMWRSMADGIVRWRTWLCLIWITAAVVLVPLGQRLEQRLQVRAEIDDSDSGRADTILNRDFDSAFSNTVIITVTGIGALDSARLQRSGSWPLFF